jgi:hypothetical protein
LTAQNVAPTLQGQPVIALAIKANDNRIVLRELGSFDEFERDMAK